MSDAPENSSDATDLEDREAAARDEPNASDPEICRFVTFGMDDEIFAVPLNDVREVVRPPAIVAVPMSSPSLQGLANLRGSILPIVDLRRLLRMDPAAHADSTRVIVIDNHGAIGLVVDRMDRVVSTPAREIEEVGENPTEARQDILKGAFKGPRGPIRILDTSKLTVETRRSGPLERATPIGEVAAATAGAQAATSDVQLVSFSLADQEYALPIESVREIVRVPESINAIPNCPSHVLGVMNLRDSLLPLVGLRSLFGLPRAPISDRNRVVVLSYRIDGGERAVGLVTDSVREVLRVPPGLIDPLPGALSGDASLREIDRTCRLESGKRVVAILAQDRLLTNVTIPAAGGATSVSRTETQMRAEKDGEVEDQYVVFRVADEDYGIPIASVQEILRIPEQFTWAPNCPEFVEGIVNLRGTVLPVIDQRRRFGLPERERDDRQRIMVFHIQGVRAGFIVDSVSEVLQIARSDIVAAPELATNEDSAVSRVANIVKSKRIILMLDAERLLTQPESRSLRMAS
jgi:purine-binding chemotaxis protein CheW